MENDNVSILLAAVARKVIETCHCSGRIIMCGYCVQIRKGLKVLEESKEETADAS